MDGIALGCSPTSNVPLVYNPRNKQFHEPETHRLDPYRIPSSMYSNIKYDGGSFCSLVKDGALSQDKAYPPGTHMIQEDPTTWTLHSGTVMAILLDSSQPVEQQLYLIEFDNFTTIFTPIADMPRYTPKPPVSLSPATKNNPLLPDFLQLKKKITYEHDRQYYQGHIGQHEGICQCVYKRHSNCKDKECPPSLILPTTGVASASKESCSPITRCPLSFAILNHSILTQSPTQSVPSTSAKMPHPHFFKLSRQPIPP